MSHHSAGFNGHHRGPGDQHRPLVVQRLPVEQLAAGHGHHPDPHLPTALGAKHLGRAHRKIHLCAGADDDEGWVRERAAGPGRVLNAEVLQYIPAQGNLHTQRVDDQYACTTTTTTTSYTIITTSTATTTTTTKTTASTTTTTTIAFY